jgi:hypothetical protein
MLAYVKMGRQTLILVPSSLMTMGEPTFHFFASPDIEPSGDGNLYIFVVAEDDE